MHQNIDNTTLRLQLSFLVMVLLISSMGLLSAYNSAKINDHLTMITENIQARLALVTDMKSNARERSLALQVMVLSEDAFFRDDYWMLFNRYGARFADARTALLAMEKSDEEALLLEKQKLSTMEVIPIQMKIAELAILEEVQQANKLIIEQALPLQNTVFLVLDELYEYYSEQLDREKTSARQAYQNIKIINWIAGLSAIVLALFTGIWVIKRIHRYQDNLKNSNDSLSHLVNVKTEALKAAEIKQRKIVENAIDGILTIGEDGSIQTVNPSALKILSVEEKDIMGYSIGDFFSFHQRKDFCHIVTNKSQYIMDTLVGHEIETEYTNKNDKMVPLNLGFTRNTSEQYVDYSCFIRDLTQQKRIDKIKSEFVSTVSHELRTPLTSIRGSLGLIVGGALGEVPEKMLKMLLLADNNVKRLLALINDILDIQKIESGMMKFSFEPNDLLKILEEAKNENLGYAEQFDVSIVLETALTQASVNLDKHRMLQVLANLLSNAIKFSDAESHVILKLEKFKNNYRVWVIDHGVGIGEEFQEKLFEKFTQEDSSDTRKKGGTGLGLPIVQVILESHMSKLEFETKIGVGTKFYFDLPIVEN